MIVGEPSLMGGEMEDEDERYITRLENVHYDPNSTSSFLSPKPPAFANANPIKREPTSFSPSPLPSNGTLRPPIASHDEDSSNNSRKISIDSSSNGSNIGGEKSPPVTPQQTIPT